MLIRLLIPGAQRGMILKHIENFNIREYEKHKTCGCKESHAYECWKCKSCRSMTAYIADEISREDLLLIMAKILKRRTRNDPLHTSRWDDSDLSHIINEASCLISDNLDPVEGCSGGAGHGQRCYKKKFTTDCNCFQINIFTLPQPWQPIASISA